MKPNSGQMSLLGLQSFFYKFSRRSLQIKSARHRNDLMRYRSLATDYDGTIASHGTVADSTITVLKRVAESGRKLVLVTGRHLPDLKNVFFQLDLFDRAVLENGALLYRPASNTEQLLCEPPPRAFLDALQERGIPFTPGRAVVACWEPHQDEVMQTIRDLGLDLQVTFNKGAVMVLPTGIDKATGLKVALEELNISPNETVSIGDAENDYSLLRFCGVGVAVANALPSLKSEADLVTENRNGAGVVELCDALLNDDLASLEVLRSRTPQPRS